MDEEMPLGGHRMVLALTDLAPQELEQLVTEYLKSLPVLHWNWLADARDKLWLGLLSRASRGEIEFWGVKHGADQPRRIHRGLLQGSKPDFLTDQLEASGATYYAVCVSLTQARELIVAAGSSANRCAYSEGNLSAWFLLRVGCWPVSVPLPDEKADLSAAELFFDAMPSRDEFRRIRAKKTPPEWRKRGPRAAR